MWSDPTQLVALVNSSRVLQFLLLIICACLFIRFILCWVLGFSVGFVNPFLLKVSHLKINTEKIGVKVRTIRFNFSLLSKNKFSIVLEDVDIKVKSNDNDAVKEEAVKEEKYRNQDAKELDPNTPFCIYPKSWIVRKLIKWYLLYFRFVGFKFSNLSIDLEGQGVALNTESALTEISLNHQKEKSKFLATLRFFHQSVNEIEIFDSFTTDVGGTLDFNNGELSKLHSGVELRNLSVPVLPLIRTLPKSSKMPSSSATPDYNCDYYLAKMKKKLFLYCYFIKLVEKFDIAFHNSSINEIPIADKEQIQSSNYEPLVKFELKINAFAFCVQRMYFDSPGYGLSYTYDDKPFHVIYNFTEICLAMSSIKYPDYKPIVTVPVMNFTGSSNVLFQTLEASKYHKYTDGKVLFTGHLSDLIFDLSADDITTVILSALDFMKCKKKSHISSQSPEDSPQSPALLWLKVFPKLWPKVELKLSIENPIFLAKSPIMEQFYKILVLKFSLIAVEFKTSRIIQDDGEFLFSTEQNINLSNTKIRYANTNADVDETALYLDDVVLKQKVDILPQVHVSTNFTSQSTTIDLSNLKVLHGINSMIGELYYSTKPLFDQYKEDIASCAESTTHDLISDSKDNDEEQNDGESDKFEEETLINLIPQWLTQVVFVSYNTNLVMGSRSLLIPKELVKSLDKLSENDLINGELRKVSFSVEKWSVTLLSQVGRNDSELQSSSGVSSLEDDDKGLLDIFNDTQTFKGSWKLQADSSKVVGRISSERSSNKTQLGEKVFIKIPVQSIAIGPRMDDLKQLAIDFNLEKIDMFYSVMTHFIIISSFHLLRNTVLEFSQYGERLHVPKHNAEKAKQGIRTRELLNKIHVNFSIKYLDLIFVFPDRLKLKCEVTQASAIVLFNSPILVNSHYLRLCAESPTAPGYWARILTAVNGSTQVNIQDILAKNHETSWFDLANDTCHLTIPHQFIIYKVFDNISVMVKTLRQLHHSLKFNTNEIVINPQAKPAKRIPTMNMKSNRLLFSMDDDPFESELNMIFQVGLIEQKMRYAKTKIFDAKIAEELQNTRQRTPKSATFPTTGLGHDVNSDLPNVSKRKKFFKPTRSSSFSPTRHAHSMEALHDDRRERNADENQKLSPDFNKVFDVRQNAMSKLTKMREGFSKSWIARVKAFRRNQEREFQRSFKYLWGNVNLLHLPDTFNRRVLDFITAPSLFNLILENVDLDIGKPSFGIEGIPDFIYDIGKGKSKDSEYSTLIPVHLDLKLGELRCHLRDYPLPFIYMPRVTKDQNIDSPAVRIHGDVVVGENTIKSHKEVREVYVPLVPGCDEFDEDNRYSIEVPKTLTSIKFYTKLDWDLNSSETTKVTWGTSYQPCIQQIMLNLDNFTKPPIDPSEKVGFWDKLRANFHARFNFHWKQKGRFDVIFKGSKNPYDICGVASGFLLGFQDDITLNVNERDDPNEFLVVNSQDVMFAVPNHLAESLLVWCRDTDHSIFLANQSTNFQSSTYGYYFNVDEIPDPQQVEVMAEHYLEKVAIKLSGGVKFNLAFFFERKTDDGNERTSDFKSHDDVVLCNPKYVGEREEYDAYHHFRSHYIHMGLTLKSKSEGAYNTIQLTPLTFHHFFNWWHMFSNTFPVRHGRLFGPEKATKKFSRHLYTIKYQAIADPLFISHVYHDHESKGPDQDKLSSVGMKARASKFILDLHQRKELTFDHNPQLDVTKKIMKMGFNNGQVSMKDLDLRTVKGFFELDKDLNMARKRATGEKTGHNHNFEVFDGDETWFDIHDFTELGTSTLDGYKSMIHIHPLMFTPSFMYFKKNDHDDKFQINIETGERVRPFGNEQFHKCLISGHNSIHVQQESFSKRIEELIDKKNEKFQLVDELKSSKPIIKEKRREVDQLMLEIRKLDHGIGFLLDLAAAYKASTPQDVIEQSSYDLNIDDDFDKSPFRNKFILHNMLLKWNDNNRDIVYKYISLFEMGSEFGKYMQHKSLCQIDDIIEAQARRSEFNSRFSRQHTQVTQGTYESKTLPDLENQSCNKSVAETRASERLKNFEQELYEIPIDLSYVTQENYLLKLVSPQIQLQSEESNDSTVIIVAPNIELKVLAFDVDETEYNENVIEQKFGAVLTDASAFVFYQDDKNTRSNVFFSNSNYGSSTSWPPWVGIELCYDSEILKNHMLMERTSVIVRYDKPDESYFVNDRENGITKVSCDLSQAVFKCDARQYYSLYSMVMNLLIYNEPKNTKLKEKESKMLLRLDVNDISNLKERIIRLQDTIRSMNKIENNLTGRRSILDDVERNDLLVVSNQKHESIVELYLLMRVALLGGRQSKASDDYLEWNIRADDIKLHMLDEERLPFLDVLLTNSHFKRIEGSDRSDRNVVIVEKVEVFNLEKNCELPILFAPYDIKSSDNNSNNSSNNYNNNNNNTNCYGNNKDNNSSSNPMIHVFWKMDNPVGGIRVIHKFEIGLEPLQLNIDQFTGEKIMKYAFPEESPLLSKSTINSHNGNGTTNSNQKIGPNENKIEDLNGDDDNGNDGNDENDVNVNIDGFDENVESHINGNGHRVEININGNNQQDYEENGLKLEEIPEENGYGNGDDGNGNDYEGEGKGDQINGHRRQPSGKRSLFSFKSKDTNNSHNSSNLNKTFTNASHSTNKSSKRKLYNNDEEGDDDGGEDDDDDEEIEEMIRRASNYLSIVSFRFKSCIINVTYRGHGAKRLINVSNFTLKMPEMIFTNQTWTLLDLTMGIKKLIIKALLNHTGSILGNKLSKHRKKNFEIPPPIKDSTNRINSFR